MKNKLKPYIRTLFLTLESRLQYRLDLIFNICCNVIPIIAIIALWQSIYKINENDKFSLSEIITYMIIAKLIEQITMPSIQWKITREIINGDIIKFLIKPMSYLLYILAWNIGNKISILITSVFPLGFLILMYQKNFILVDPNNILFFCVSILLSFLMAFFFYFFVSMLSFKFIEISSFFFTLEIIVEFLSGAVIPLSLLPSWLTKIVYALPFSYMIDFPISIYLSRISNYRIYIGILIQLIWVFVFFLLSIFSWKIGVKNYDGVGV